MGFDEMIPVGVPLPYRRKASLRTMFDNIDSDKFTLAYRHSPRHSFEVINTITLENIRKGQAKDAILYATMSIDSTLNGLLHLRDPYTKSEASLTFDARVPPPTPLLLGNCPSNAPIDS